MGGFRTPGDFVPSQEYRSVAPYGIDVDYTRDTHWNAVGGFAVFADMEPAWNLNHGDLPSPASDSRVWLVNGEPSVNAAQRENHGTSSASPASLLMLGRYFCQRLSQPERSQAWPTRLRRRRAQCHLGPFYCSNWQCKVQRVWGLTATKTAQLTTVTRRRSSGTP